MNIDDLYAAVAESLKSKNTSDWLVLLSKADIPAGPANSLDDLFDDPHLKAIGFFREHEHPSEGSLILPDTPYRLNGESLPLRQPVPRLGQHTHDVLAELGYTDLEIKAVIEANL